MSRRTFLALMAALDGLLIVGSTGTWANYSHYCYYCRGGPFPTTYIAYGGLSLGSSDAVPIVTLAGLGLVLLFSSKFSRSLVAPIAMVALTWPSVIYSAFWAYNVHAQNVFAARQKITESSVGWGLWLCLFTSVAAACLGMYWLYSQGVRLTAPIPLDQSNTAQRSGVDGQSPRIAVPVEER
jgi:hypothetical protein